MSVQGRKFGPASEDYERGRPGWPVAAVDRLATGLGLGADATVLDLGAGTGKLTRVLAQRFARVLAVEPLGEMRDRLAAARLPRVEVQDGSAERLPVDAGTVQAVFVAEAFHWFDGPVALAEAARVLVPDGGIGLLWNLPAGPTEPPLPEPARELVRVAVARGGQPGGSLLASQQWRVAFPDSAFGALRYAQLPHQHTQDRDGLVANAMSISSVAGLPEPERAELRARLTELIPAGQYRRPLHAELYWASLAPWCDRCGEPRTEGDHPGCAAARELEPPRFCPRCRRRMRVQVLPAGWAASCVAHGETRSQPG